MNIGPKGTGVAGTGQLPGQQGSAPNSTQALDEAALSKELEALVYGGSDDSFSSSKYDLGYGSGTQTTGVSSQSDALAQLASNPALFETALRLAYYNTGNPSNPSASRDHSPPQITPQSSQSLSQLNQLFEFLASQDDQSNASDTADYSALPYASRLLDPPNQRVLQAQLMGDPANAPSNQGPAASDSGSLISKSKVAAAPSVVNISSSAQQLLQDAETAFNNQDFKGAYAKFSQAVSASPNLTQQMPELNYYLGVSAEYSGDPATLAKAQSYFQNYVASPDADAQTKTWVQNELSSGLPAQVAIQNANTAYDKKDYDTAFKGYENALNADPQLAQSWPSILYQLGTSAQFSKDPATNAKAINYYQQYTASSDADPKTVAWVNSQIPRLKIPAAANAASQKAQDEMWKENNPYTALSVLKGAVAKYPELSQNDPSVYYYLALYAYSSADVPDAKKYIAQAQKAMAGQDQSSSDTQYYNTQISQLSQEINTFNASTWSSDKLRGLLSHALGNGRAAQQIAQEFGRGLTNWWIPMGGTRGASNLWEASRDMSGRTDRPPAFTSSEAQKHALSALDNKVDTAKTSTEKDAAVNERSDFTKTLGTSEAEAAAGKVVASAGEKAGGLDATTKKLESSELGPGWWGLGTTLAHAQSAGLQWSLGQDSSTGKIKSDWRGPFATTSKYDPTSQGVTLAKGGKGVSQYTLSANAGLNVANAEARAYDMLYGGGSIANSAQGSGLGNALGIGGMLGGQVRADDFDMQGGFNLSGGSDKIGNTQINNLVSGNVSGGLAVGSQADATISAGIGKQSHLGASLGAFTGAQATGCVGGSIDGVGAALVGQAWAGFGAKVTANLGFQNRRLTLNLGAGAALGVGGFADIALTIDFNQICDELKGIGSDADKLSRSWGKKAPVVGQVAGALVGGGEGLLKLGGDTLSSAGNLVDTVEKGIEKKTGIVGKVLLAAVPISTAAQVMEAPKMMAEDLKKKPSEDFSDAKTSLKNVKVVNAATQAVAGGAKWIGNKLVGLFK